MERREFRTENIIDNVLGYHWDNKNVVLKIPFPKLNIMDSDQRITKRMMLKIIGKLYDPIGFVNPFTAAFCKSCSRQRMQ